MAGEGEKPGEGEGKWPLPAVAATAALPLPTLLQPRRKGRAEVGAAVGITHSSTHVTRVGAWLTACLSKGEQRRVDNDEE